MARNAPLTLALCGMLSLDIIIPAFNAERVLGSTLEAIYEQTLPVAINLGVIVVNNRSVDGTADVIAQWAAKGVRLIDEDSIQGRSAACNAGVQASSADYVLILDADCRLAGKGALQLICDVMNKGVGAGFGYASAATDDFWGRYYRSLEAGRRRAGWQGFTTACCLIRRELLTAVGGFSTEYQHYGFEDRDFVCRLKEHEADAAIIALPELRVIHDDETSVPEICEKMYTSGRYSGGIFKRNFPDAYLASGYARVDVDTAPGYMAMALRILQPLQPLFARLAEYLARRRQMPLAIGRPLLRLCSALSYFRGTVDRARDR